MDNSASSLLALQLIVLVMMLFGLFGLLTTIIPGLVIIWLAALVYWIGVGFTTSGWIVFGFVTVLMLVGSVLDNVVMGASARKTGASWLAIAVSLIAGVAGSLVWPPFGGLITALIGLFVVEYIRLRNWRQALDSTRSMAAGCGWSVILRFAIGLLMMLLWGAWVVLS